MSFLAHFPLSRYSKWLSLKRSTVPESGGGGHFGCARGALLQPDLWKDCLASARGRQAGRLGFLRHRRRICFFLMLNGSPPVG